ncbi:ABC transporter ATP-binding protein [candidate division KSB1 bacterium]|nr:ABC transporter ATP-binding protein [candidate division KSB1 bacterium]
MLTINHISKNFDDVAAVRDISLQIAEGEIFGFIGNNGAGKTTTIKIIAGLLKPDSGEVFINKRDALKFPLEARKNIGYAPEEPVLYDYLSGIEFLDFIGAVKGVPPDSRKKQIEELLQLFALQVKAREMIKTYSHGMRKKMALAAALMSNPGILLLDEPMTGLDPECSFKLKQRLSDLAAAGTTVFFSSHILETVEKLCHRIGIIHLGQLLFTGTLQELRSQFKESQTLEDIFMQLTRDQS